MSALVAVVMLGVAIAVTTSGMSADGAGFSAVVEAEEDVYTFTAADNGAGPMWSYGSSCIARVGDEVFISGLETLPEAKPLNNVRWQLFRRGSAGWEVVAKGPGRTREPCPLACFQDGRLFLSDNPTLTPPDTYQGPARPEVLQFSTARPTDPYRTLLPAWDGEPSFTEHSYRSFAADARSRELILFQNVGYTHAEWTFLDRDGKWSARGKLKWPWGAEYPEPQPIRVCYPTVALKDKRVYFCGVSDIVEPYPEWRQYKKELTGRDWDYDFRRLFFTWSDDITTGRFHDWVEISSRDKTCGWIFPCDLWVGPDGAVHLLWTERAVDERLRAKFFPAEKQAHALMYALIRDGQIVLKRPLHLGGEGASSEIPGDGRFQVTEDGRLFVFYYLRAKDREGNSVSQNRLLEIRRDGTQSDSLVVDLKRPFTKFYTATWRAGSAPSHLLDLYGTRAGKGDTLSYARVRIK
jgi:hypothetical protein